MLGTNPLLASFLPVADANVTIPLANGESVTQTSEPTDSTTSKNLPRAAWREAVNADTAAEEAAAAQGDFGGDPGATLPGVDIQSQDYDQTPLAAGIAPPGQLTDAPVVPPPEKSPDEAYQDVISQALKGNPPKEPLYDPSAGPGISSRQFNKEPQLNPPRTFRAAQDEANSDRINATNTEAEAQITRQKEIERWKAEQTDAALKYMNELADEKQKNSHITSLFEDMSVPRRILSALAVGFGAYGAGLTGGPNTAAQMLQKEMDQDLERKKFKAQQTIEQMHIAGARPEQIRAAATQMQTEALATHQAALAHIQTLADKVLAPFPQAQQSARAAVADALAKKEVDKRNFVATHLDQTMQHEGLKRQVTSGGTKAGGGDEQVRASLQRGSLHEIEGDLALLAKTGGLSDKEQNAISTAADRIQAAAHAGTTANELAQTTGIVKHDPIEVLPKARRPIALAARRVELAMANANARTALTGDELASARQQYRAPLGVGTEARKSHYQSLQRIAATPAETGIRAETRIQRAQSGPPKQLTTLQIAKAPRQDAADYMRLSRKASATPSEQNFVKAFEARYGR